MLGNDERKEEREQVWLGIAGVLHHVGLPGPMC